MIESVYLVCGLILPAFYVPQIIRLHRDQTRLGGYSLGKSFCQFALRIPAMLFAFWVVKNPLMNLVVGMDVLGRTIELAVAIASMRRQGVHLGDIVLNWFAMARRINPVNLGWKLFAMYAAIPFVFAGVVAHALETRDKPDNESVVEGVTNLEAYRSTGGYLDSR